LPSAMRSGQNATSSSTPSPATIFSTRAVTPGTVLRRIRIWPEASAARSPASRSGWPTGPARGFAHRGADDHDHVLAGAHDRGVRRGHEAACGDRALQCGRGARLGEGHLGRVHARDRGLADVEDAHPQASRGEGDGQRQAHVPAPADHHDVPCEGCRAGRFGHRATSG
jgi:hypothetical protein